MTTTRPLARTMFFVLAAFAATTGCAADRDEAPRDAARPEVPGASPDPGAAAGSAGAQRLPEGFPTQFPLPPDLQVTAGHCAPPDAAANASCTLRGTSTSSVAALAAFFEDALPRAGFRLDEASPTSPDATMARLSFEGERFEAAYVRLSQESGQSGVTIHLPYRR